MASECPTGILIDFIEDITASNSCQSNEKEHDTLNGKPYEIENSHEKEETSGCQASVVNSCSNPRNGGLGGEFNKKYERDSWSGWRTPSPTSMNMINEEALRIVDQLDTTLEISLWDEEFPLSSNLEEDCSEEYFEPEVLSCNVASNSLNSKTLSCNVNVIKRDIVIENELVSKCLITSKGDFSSIEKNIITKETCSLQNPDTLSDDFLSETISGITENTGHTGTNEGCSGSSKECSCEIKSGIVRGNCGTGEGVTGDVKENFGINRDSSGICKKSSNTPNESSDTFKKPFIKEHCLDSTEKNYDVFERKCDTLGSSSATLGENCGTLNESCITLEGSSDALEKISESIERNSGTPIESSVILEKNFSANKKCGTSEKCYVNASEEKSCDKVGTEKVCDIIKASCLVIEENSFLTKDNSTVTEEIKAVAVVNSSMMAECSNVGVSNSIADMKKRHLSSESLVKEKSITSTPSKSFNMKSKFGKVFNRSSLKTPTNHNKAKENIFQESKDKNALSENKTCKIGSSAKSNLQESNVNGSANLTIKPNIKTPLSKRILGKIPFARGENKLNSLSQNQTKENIKQPNTLMKSTDSLQFPPASSMKTPLGKSNSVMNTPNLVKPVRRSNSFQTRPFIENSNVMKREKSFVAVSHLKTLNSRMSLHQTAKIGNELKTPLKNSSILSKHTSNKCVTPSSNTKSYTRASQIACPSFGSALKQINTPIPGSKPLLGFKRPVSTTSKTRFCSRLELPSPLPKEINDNIPRQLFPDNTPKKRFN